MANMTFGVDLIPNNNTQQRKLGNSENKWDINANTITATTINGNAATTSTAGLMSAEDKVKLNGIETGAEVNPNIVNNLTETTTGKVLDATQGKVLNDTKLNKDFNFTAATLPYANTEKIALRGTDGNNYYTTIGELASQIGGGGGTSQTALVHYIKNCGTISSLNWTNSTIDNNITENMVVLKAELSNPAAQTSNWTCTTSNGYVTISGTISGSTNVLLYFGVSLSTAPSIIVNLASNSADNVLKTSPTPGVMGVLGPGNGGTGVSATDAADLRSKLGIAMQDISSNVTSDKGTFTNNKQIHTILDAVYVTVELKLTSQISPGGIIITGLPKAKGNYVNMFIKHGQTPKSAYMDNTSLIASETLSSGTDIAINYSYIKQ